MDYDSSSSFFLHPQWNPPSPVIKDWVKDYFGLCFSLFFFPLGFIFLFDDVFFITVV
jgi:hypothetical protein